MRVYKDVGLVEQLGSGMSRILKAYDKSIYQISEHFIKIIFPFADGMVLNNTANGGNNGSNNGANIANETKILELMKETPEITINEISRRLNLSTRKISRIIKTLRENGSVVRVGSTRKGYWKINE